MRQKIDFEPGKKYPGYGILNEYGEFEFIPEQTGSRKGTMKQIKQTKEYTLSQTKKKIIIHICMEKEKGIKVVQTLLRIMNELITDLRTYEI